MTIPAVDWGLAEATAQRLVRPGPEVTHEEAQAAVAALRACAERAGTEVAAVTGLRGVGEVPTLIVDRANWLTANVATFAELLTPHAETPVGLGATFGARLSGVEVGALLAYISRRVLGQYDPYHSTQGRLLLVAPNIVHLEREIEADPADFRLWVALHEQTHVLQFTSTSTLWLRDYVRSRITQLVTTTDLDSDMLAAAVRGVAASVRDKERPGLELADLVRDPEQRQLIDHLTAIMTLLEGHADVVMDEVGPQVVPSVARIRSRFELRRDRGGVERVIRNALGLDAKLRQYRDGAKFCRAVLAQIGMAGLNRVFDSPETLPTLAEIAAPDQWLQRVRPAA